MSAGGRSGASTMNISRRRKRTALGLALSVGLLLGVPQVAAVSKDETATPRLLRATSSSINSSDSLSSASASSAISMQEPSQLQDECALPASSDGRIDCRTCVAQPNCSLVVSTGQCVSTIHLDPESAALRLDGSLFSFCEDARSVSSKCSIQDKTVLCHGLNGCIWLPYCSASLNSSASLPQNASVPPTTEPAHAKRPPLSLRLYVFAIMFFCVATPVGYYVWHTVSLARDARHRLEQEEMRIRRFESNPLNLKLTAWRLHRQQQGDDLLEFKTKDKVPLQRLGSCYGSEWTTDSEGGKVSSSSSTQSALEEDEERSQVPFTRLREVDEEAKEEESDGAFDLKACSYC